MNIYNKYNYSVIAGVVSTFALPPFNISILILIGMPALYYLLTSLDHRSYKKSFVLGLYFAVGMLAPHLYWIANSAITKISIWWWSIPFTILCPSLLMGSQFALASMVFNIMPTRKNTILSIILFSSLMTLAQYSYSHWIFNGFPWGILGYTWIKNPEVVQIISVIGIYILTLLTFIYSLLIVLAISDAKNIKNLIFIIVSILIFIANYYYGYNILKNNPTKYNKNFKVHLIQVNNKIEDRNISFEKAKEDLQNYINTSLLIDDDKSDVDHILIWPESAYPFILNNNINKLPMVDGLNNHYLITGVNRKSIYGEKYYNSAFIFDKNLQLMDFYDKKHLVPFGEYFPLDILLSSITSLINLTPGSNKQQEVFAMKGSKISKFIMQICYEIVFPNEIKNTNSEGKWIINITNDAWFGDTIGPYQHLLMVTSRAIEEGLPIVRSVNGGISAIIDAYGRIIDYIPLNKNGFISSYVPLPTKNKTIYSKYSKYIDIYTVILPIILIIYILTIYNKKYI
ncbi:MAG: apolipoprotein N-acyltransferase [Anaplasmataceae bacterium]|nr:apolipoprotein N-acyltransferase [Anaplasmataceae bacterium]